MDLYYECGTCQADDIWRIRIHGTRPYARAVIGDVRCPVCQSRMTETGPCDCLKVRELGMATG